MKIIYLVKKKNKRIFSLLVFLGINFFCCDVFGQQALSTSQTSTFLAENKQADNYVDMLATSKHLTLSNQMDETYQSGVDCLKEKYNHIKNLQKSTQSNPYIVSLYIGSLYYGGAGAGVVFVGARFGFGYMQEDLLKPVIGAGIAGTGIAYWFLRKQQNMNKNMIDFLSADVRAQQAQLHLTRENGYGIAINHAAIHNAATTIMADNRLVAAETVKAVNAQREFAELQMSQQELRSPRKIETIQHSFFGGQLRPREGFWNYMPSLETTTKAAGFGIVASLLALNLSRK
ncbi:hypothetical protein K9K77_01410 [Candidatus Babeliales bacterium]|nr:hypothetical protein [Candidatus Babeliales bacterium]